MAELTPDVSALSLYAGTRQNELMGKLYKALNLQGDGITVMQDVRSKTLLPRIAIGKGLKPATRKFVARDGDFKYSDRSIVVEMAQRDVLIDPDKYRSTYLNEYVAASMGTNSNLASQIPFEAFTWGEFMKENAQEVVEMLYHGKGKAAFTAYNTANTYAVGALVTTTIDTELRYFRAVASVSANQTPVTNPEKWESVDNLAIIKGWGQIIQDEISAGFSQVVATGAVNATNAYAKFTQVFRAQREQVKASGALIYCSYNQYENLVDNYEDVVKKNFSETDKISVLPKTDGKCLIKPVSWLSGSNRLICTPANNLVLATDQLSDMNRLKTIEDMYALKVSLTFLVGLNFKDLDVLVVNDQA